MRMAGEMITKEDIREANKLFARIHRQNVTINTSGLAIAKYEEATAEKAKCSQKLIQLGVNPN